MAAAAQPMPNPPRWTGTPEIYFPKAIDNSRLVTVRDTCREREMAIFTCAIIVLFTLVLAYGWQHQRALEYGYEIEQLKSERDTLTELNRALRLEEASLKDPERIDLLARGMGLVLPEVGQVVRLDAAPPRSDAPVLARVSVISVSP